MNLGEHLDGSRGDFTVVYADELLSVREVGFEPECSASDVESGFKAGEKDGVEEVEVVEH